MHLHWGEELNSCPLPRQQELARELVAAGADVIVGGHAHVPLGGGFMNGRYVHYGLGNFVFYSAHDADRRLRRAAAAPAGPQGHQGGVATGPISGGLPRLLSGAPAAAELKRWNGLRGCTGLSATP